ncbi:MAG TPA: RNA polymerase sigma factor region1.1 domain-containing protein [Candidatus Acidoferrum sp.]|nr:RNA polymerase sigma factor region1.1 domain-containing protein [Candidatus Acidoferrum sp.]
MARRIDDEFGHVQQLSLIGKERGYLLYDEINDSLPTDVHPSQEIDDLLSTFKIGLPMGMSHRLQSLV